MAKPSYRLERAFVVARYESSGITSLLKANGFYISERTPDFIVCYGGDGTILYAERCFPGIPKLIIRKSGICRKCDYSVVELETILRKIRRGEFCVKDEMKLETEFRDSNLVGLNEIQVHARLPIHAIRFSLSYNGNTFDNLIGDGVVVATPFGSSGYYKSTGGQSFTAGIGISFNNLHNKTLESFIVPKKTVIQVMISRGPAFVWADNNEKFLELQQNDAVRIKRSREPANFIHVTSN